MRKLFGLGLLLGAFWAVGCGDNSAPTAGGDKSSPKGTNTVAVGEPNVVQPPGSPLATYQVGRISYLDDAKDSAYVESILNEPTGNGQETKPWEIVWAVRLEGDGWKIAGFAFEISDDQAPMVVDFENGADMKAKIEGTAPQPTQQPPTQQPPTQTAENPALPAATGEVRR